MYLLLGLSLFILYLSYSPNLIDYEPKAYSVEMPEGSLVSNNRLSQAEKLFENQLIAPECLDVHEDSIYTGTADGYILRIQGKNVYPITRVANDCEGPWEQEKCGRPLGLRFDNNGTLYVVDAYYGLLKIDVNTGSKEVLLSGNTIVDGKRLIFLDDFAIDDNGDVYISDASTKWPVNMVIYVVTEYENTGRLLKYNPKTKTVSVVLNGLHFPNGVQMHKHGDSILIAETNTWKILRHYIKGPKKGETEVFSQLPGEPDNIRPSARGGYWVALVSGRTSKSSALTDKFSGYPTTRKIAFKLIHLTGSIVEYIGKFLSLESLRRLGDNIKTAKILSVAGTASGMIVELDENGKIIQTLESPDKSVALLSHVLESGGYLYLGSYFNPYLGRLKL